MLLIELTPQEAEILWKMVNQASFPGNLLEVGLELKKKIFNAGTRYNESLQESAGNVKPETQDGTSVAVPQLPRPKDPASKRSRKPKK
jgi:hypothetical protein